MKKYIVPEIKINVLSTQDIIAVSLPFVPAVPNSVNDNDDDSFIGS